MKRRLQPGRRVPMTSLLAMLAVFVLASPHLSRAARVVFRDQRVLDVVSVEVQGDLLVLNIGEGNTLTVSVRRVLEILPDPEPELETPEEEREPWRSRAGPFGDAIAAAAARHRIDPELLLAVALVESGLDPYAVSPKGAVGLMQLMPATSDELSVADPSDPNQNIEAGAAWLKRMLVAFDGDLDLALAAYNAGENAVRRFRGVPPFAETELYIERVRDHLERLRL